MSFNNASIVAPKPGKPHICLRDGYWRVSRAGKGTLSSEQYRNWARAHDFIVKLNAKRQGAMR